MAWLFGDKKFGQYTYEHWYDDDEHIVVKDSAENTKAGTAKAGTANDPCSITPDKPSPQPEPSCHNPCSQDS
ncbi:hypothetical protein R84B8_00597 [Treponema sp. R8-4-B8]